MLEYGRAFGDLCKKKKEEKYSNVMRDCPEAKADFLVLYNGQDVPTIEVLHNN